jgi:hypothetical protein
MGSFCGYCKLFPWSLKQNTYLHLEKKKENARSFKFVSLCAFITILWHGWLLELLKNYKNMVNAVVPPR